jgi:hypothetical protein
MVRGQKARAWRNRVVPENDFKWQFGALGSVEEGLGAVRKIQHPQHGHVLSCNILSFDAPVKPAPSELRFARNRVAVDRLDFSVTPTVLTITL